MLFGGNIVKYLLGRKRTFILIIQMSKATSPNLHSGFKSLVMFTTLVPHQQDLFCGIGLLEHPSEWFPYTAAHDNTSITAIGSVTGRIDQMMWSLSRRRVIKRNPPLPCYGNRNPLSRPQFKILHTIMNQMCFLFFFYTVVYVKTDRYIQRRLDV